MSIEKKILIEFVIDSFDLKNKEFKLNCVFYREGEFNTPIMILTDNDLQNTFINMNQYINNMKIILTTYSAWNEKMGIVRFKKTVKAKIIQIYKQEKQWMFEKIGYIAGLNNGLIFLEVEDEEGSIHVVDSTECLYDIITEVKNEDE